MPLTLVSPLITYVLRVEDGAKADNAGNRFVVYRAGHIWLKLVRGEEKKPAIPRSRSSYFLPFLHRLFHAFRPPLVDVLALSARQRNGSNRPVAPHVSNGG